MFGLLLRGNAQAKKNRQRNLDAATSGSGEEDPQAMALEELEATGGAEAPSITGVLEEQERKRRIAGG